MASFAERLRELRKKLDLSQDQLGEKIGIHGRQIGKYESRNILPNTDGLIKIAQFFDVTIDYLLTGDEDADDSIKDKELLRKVKAIDQMNETDKEIVITLMDAFIQRQQIKSVLMGSKRSAQVSDQVAVTAGT